MLVPARHQRRLTVLDARLRPVKERLVVPASARLGARVAPDVISALALVVTLGAAGLAWADRPILALTAWLLGRILDGLDGPVARSRGMASDWGGYVDIVADHVGYAVVPIGVALGLDTRAGWITVAVLLGAFFVNAISWSFLAAVLEKRGAGASATGEMTTVTMPPALIEGTETIVLFSIFIAFAAIAPWVFAAMAAMVGVNIVQRLWWARAHLT